MLFTEIIKLADIATPKKLKETLNSLNNKIDTLRSNTFIKLEVLPAPSQEYLNKICLVPQEENSENNIYDEYIVLDNDGIYSWEKIGTTAIGAANTVIDDALSLESENPVKNKVITEALDKKLDLSGGALTGKLTIGQGDDNCVQLGTAGVFNATHAGADNYTVFGMINKELKVGSQYIPILLRGNGKPKYQNSPSGAIQNLATEDYVDEALDKKVDIEASTSTGYPTHIIGTRIVNNVVTAFRYNTQGTDRVSGNRIPLTFSDGRLKAGAPTEGDDLTTKDYVDEALDTKLERDLPGSTSNSNVNTVYAKDTNGNVYNHIVARGSAQISPYRMPIYFGLEESVSVNPNGALATGYPTHNYHATNKQYVDDEIAKVSSGSGVDTFYWEVETDEGGSVLIACFKMIIPNYAQYKYFVYRYGETSSILLGGQTETGIFGISPTEEGLSIDMGVDRFTVAFEGTTAILVGQMNDDNIYNAWMAGVMLGGIYGIK